jgi:hypothetical protein
MLTAARRGRGVAQLSEAHRGVVAFPQFVHQKLQMVRQRRRFRPQAPLQPLAHGLTNRSAGLAIDLLSEI